MGLNEPIPGLRPLFHNSNQPTKVTLVIPAGDELAVSDDVAAQLQAASTHFESPDTPKVAPPAADTPADDEPVEPAPKRPAKRAPAKG